MTVKMHNENVNVWETSEKLLFSGGIHVCLSSTQIIVGIGRSDPSN